MKNLTRWVSVVVVGVVVVCISGGISQASYIYSFQAFTEAGVYYDVPELGVTMEVYNGAGQVHFKFRNLSSIQSSVARIYFDDGSLLVGPTITGTQGLVVFSDVYPGPGNLPGGSNIGFQADREFSIGAVAPPPKNGINEYPPPDDEWLEIMYTLNDLSKTVEDVKYELDNEILRIGIHIISIDPALSCGDSISQVNIPEPATICLFGLGGFLLRRKRKV